MFIKKVKIKNFKKISDLEVDFNIPNGEFGSGLNIFVGENNSGKSTLMESIYFLRNKGKNIKKIGIDENDDAFVELDFTGNIEEVVDNFIQDNKKDTFKNRIFEESGENIFRVKREFKNENDIKKILFFNNDNSEFKNESGIDAPFQKFFQISNIWADTNPENEAKYGSTTICGNLLADISEKFKIENADEFERFEEEFHRIFNSDTEGMQQQLNIVAKETEEILNSQFGNAKLKFKFETPKLDFIFKNIKILVNDGEETELSEKGHGMQRAVILSLLQVYAKRITQIKNEDGDIKLKPHFLFIDEPEMGLHPQAQKKLFSALGEIARTHQVFIATHSENFISSQFIENIFKFIESNGDVEVVSGKELDIDLGVNRKFFFHHHSLFFTDRAIFLEGADDYEYYPSFCVENGLSELKKDFYFMGGAGDYKIFKQFCDHFKIKNYFIFDLDVIQKTTTYFSDYQNISSKIINLSKELTRGVSKAERAQNLFDTNLSEDEKKIKDEILSELREEGICVLPNGSFETYFQNSEIANDEKKEELLNIFKGISEQP